MLSFMNRSRAVQLSNKRWSVVVARNISVSPAAPKVVESSINSKNYRFSYETAKNKFVESSNVSTPENKFDFSEYTSKDKPTNVVSEEEAKLIPSIIALHARLGLPESYQYSTLVKALTCPTSKHDVIASNQQLSILGAHILSFYVTEYLIANYPRLPLSVLRAATDAFIGNYSLYDVAKNTWGISEDSSSKLERYLSNEPEIFKFGTLRYTRKVTEPETDIVKYAPDHSVFELSKSEAFANSVRSIVGGLHIHAGEETTKQFVHDHILSRQVDISSFFSFKEPGKLLTRLLRTNNMQPPTIRLISETGRFSSTPVYVVGCFSGENLLATSEGNSLREARIKSFGKALKAWYLYKPLDAKLPSDESFEGMFVDQGEKFF